MTPEIKTAIKEAVFEALSADSGKKYIDVSRIPLICQSIVGIHQSLEDLNTKVDDKFVTNDQFWPVKTVVYGIVALALLGVFGAIIVMAIPHAPISVS